MKEINNIIENKIDNSRRFENVQVELLDYQFKYIEKLDKKDIKVPEEDTDFVETNSYFIFRKKFKDELTTIFSKHLFEYTTLFNQLRENYDRRVSKEDFKEDIFNNWAQNIFNEVDIIYSSKDIKWRDNVLNFIKEKFDEIGPEKENEEDIEEKENIGLIHFNVTQEKELINFGLKFHDPCIDIHFSDLYKQKEKNKDIINIFSGDSFSKLACNIIDNYSYVKAIIGRSWLISSPLGERIGFVKYKENKNLRNGGFWGQFINEKGEINKERMDRFLKTGEADYYVSMGFIKIEDFLKRYLPRERRGTVKLMTRTKNAINFVEEKEHVLNKINNEFSILSFQEINKLLDDSVVSDFFKTSQGIEFLDLLKIAKKKNLKNINELKDKRTLELKDNFRYFCEEKEQESIVEEIVIE
jgi:hypothetical protein